MAVVTGAFSYSGKYITRELLQRGFAVKTITGHPSQPNPFGDAVEVMPFNFDRPDALTESLQGASVVVNTYWIRFERKGMTFARAVDNVKTLIDAAKRAGVQRFVHTSITHASSDSPLPYFHGKGVLEEYLRSSGLSYAIVRPAIIFGSEDILIHNIAWTLRRLPLFGVPGDGDYRVQPVFVEDLAKLEASAAESSEKTEIDAVGPETYTFNDLVRLIGRAVGKNPYIIRVAPSTMLTVAQALGRVMGDVLLTREEIRGLSADLLFSSQPPSGKTRLSNWLAENAATLGRQYSSELARRK